MKRIKGEIEMNEEKEYDDMSLEELQAIRDMRDKNKLRNELKKEDEINIPKNKLITSVQLKKDVGTVDLTLWNGFREELGVKGSYDNLYGHFNYASDTGCDTDISSVNPTEYFTSLVLHAVFADSGIFDASKIKIDVASGNGKVIKVPYMTTKITPTAGLDSCECVSCCSVTWSNVSLTIERVQSETEVCNFDEFQASPDLQKEVLVAMKNGLTEWFEGEYVDALGEATEGHTATLVAELTAIPSIEGSCCTAPDVINLWNSINEAKANLEDGDYYPDSIAMNAIVASVFARPSEIEIPRIIENSVTYDAKGRLASILGLKVFISSEMPAVAQGADLAYVFQSNRSLITVFGMRPKSYADPNPSCDSISLGITLYAKIDSLDDSSIAHVVNA